MSLTYLATLRELGLISETLAISHAREELRSRPAAEDRAREIERWRAGAWPESNRARMARRARCAEQDEDDFERRQRAYER